MALKLYDTLTPDGDYPLMKAKDVEMPDGTRLSELKGGEGGSVSWKNVTDKPFGEDILSICAEHTWTTQYFENYGAFAIGRNFGEGVDEWGSPTLPEFQLTLGDKCVVVWDGNEYECVVRDSSSFMEGAIFVGYGVPFGLPGSNEPFIIAWSSVGVTFVSVTDTEPTEHTISIYQRNIKPLDPKFLPVAVAVDLTAFESEGIIVETYADGSTVTTTMERNAEGKITKITDSNGNVTVLTW